MEILLLLGLSAIALARPDVGLGYHYQPPATSYGVPAGSVGSLHTNLNQQQGLVGLVSGTAPSTTFEVPIYNAGHFGANTETSQFSTSSNLGSPVSSSTLFQTAGVSGVPTASSVSGVSGVSGSFGVSGGAGVSGLTNRYQTNVKTDYQSNSYHQQGSVEKHLYFFAAPEEPETIRPRIVYPQEQSKKNVKVIFIKAPSYRIEPVQVPLQPQNEEKTKIYVLVKKPDDLQLTAVPNVGPTEQSKPEVYFVKYNNHKEAEQAISSLQNGGSAGQNANILEGDSDLINTIAKSEKKYDLDTRYFRDGDSDKAVGGSVGLASLHQNRIKSDSSSFGGDQVSSTSPPIPSLSSGFSGSFTIPGLHSSTSTVTVSDGTGFSHVESPSTFQVDFNGSVGDSSISSVNTQLGGSGDSISLSTKGSFPTVQSSTSAPELQFYLPPTSK